jgi:hypothetical protein
VRADGLNLAVVGLADGADGLEVLLASPALGQDGQRQVDLDVGAHRFGVVDAVGGDRIFGGTLSTSALRSLDPGSLHDHCSAETPGDHLSQRGC